MMLISWNVRTTGARAAMKIDVSFQGALNISPTRRRAARRLDAVDDTFGAACEYNVQLLTSKAQSQ
eukprot:4299411-Amphidinium_carterae.1